MVGLEGGFRKESLFFGIIIKVKKEIRMEREIRSVVKRIVDAFVEPGQLLDGFKVSKIWQGC